MSQEYFVGGGANSSSYATKNNKRLIIVLSALVLFLIIGFFVWFFGSNVKSSDKVGSSLISSIQNNRPDEAYAYMSDTYKSTIRKDDWTKFVTDASALISGGQIKLEFTDKSLKSSSYYVYRIKTQKNGTVNTEMRINGKSGKVETLQINRTSI